MERKTVYFVSDVHLGLKVGDPADREKRFVEFLRSIPCDSTRALYMLGDIWDFWYEYKDVIPKGYARVFAALIDLMDAGVEVHFFPGNHDLWNFGWFESLGFIVHEQPYEVEYDGVRFCLGHGDGLGPVDKGYMRMNAIFKSKFTQALFSSIHPGLSFRFARNWSSSSRSKHSVYTFRGAEEPLYKFAAEYGEAHKTDVFIFGHYHDRVDLTLPSGARLLMTESWVDSSPYLYFSGNTVFFGGSQNSEK